MRARTSATVTALVLVAAAALSGSCGIPADSTARRSDPADVPFALLAPGDMSSTVATPTTSGSIYLARKTKIEAVPRQVDSPPSAQSWLTELTAGPTPEEAKRGLRTPVVRPNLIGNVREGGGLIQIDLTQDITTLPPPDQLLAFAVIVYTATESSSDDTVAFTVESQPIQPLRPDGQSIDGPVKRADYEALVLNT